MKQKLHYILFTILVLSVCSFGQTKEQTAECNEQCRTKLTEQAVAEAKKFGLNINIKGLVTASDSAISTAFVPVEGLQNINENKLREKIIVGLYAIKSAKDKSGLNGIFRLQLSKQQKKIPRKNSTVTTIKMELLNYEGKVVKENVLTKFEIPAVTAFVKPKACWIGGSYGVCFPEGTSSFQIHMWEIMCEDGCPMSLEPGI